MAKVKWQKSLSDLNICHLPFAHLPYDLLLGFVTLPANIFEHQNQSRSSFSDEHRHLGVHLCGCQRGACRRFSTAFPGRAVYAGRTSPAGDIGARAGGAGGNLPRFYLGIIPLCGISLSDIWLNLYHTLEKRLPHRFQRDPGAADRDALRL